MKRSLIFVGVMVALGSLEAEERIKALQRSIGIAKDIFWLKYDHAVNLAMDELERRRIIRTQDYSTHKH